MRRLIAIAALLLLAACSQNPFQPLNPVGYWAGSWTGSSSLEAFITQTTSGWQGIFTSNGVQITALCSNPDDQPSNYLYCGAFTSSEVIVWEGGVVGNSWSGVWTYIGPSGNDGGSFSLSRL